MAIPTILKGDATNANGRTVAIHLPDEDLDGFKLRFEYLGITREFEELTRGGTVYADFSESETALFPLGTHLGTIRLGRAGRWHMVSATVPVKVSDNVGEVYGGDAANINLSIDFCGGIPDLSGIETEPTTANALARAFKALVDALKGAAGTAALIACMAAFGAPRMTVHSAPLGEVAFGNRVVTGVEFDESGLVTGDDIADVVREDVLKSMSWTNGNYVASVLGIVNPMFLTDDFAALVGGIADESLGRKFLPITGGVIASDGSNASRLSIGDERANTAELNVNGNTASTVNIGPGTSTVNIGTDNIATVNIGHYHGDVHVGEYGGEIHVGDDGVVIVAPNGASPSIKKGGFEVVTEYDLNITSNALANAIVVAGGFTPEMATNVARSVVKPHIDNRDNPHKVTAAQVGAYTKAEVNAKGYVTASVTNGLATAESVDGLAADVAGKADAAAVYTKTEIDEQVIAASNQTFSNAVLAVGLNIDTNFVAVLNEIADSFGGFPIEGTATTVGGLLAALAAAVAWLKKHAKETDTRIDQIEHSSNPNMNVIGNPVFKEGSVSGFSANDYMVFPSQVSVGQSSVEFYLSFMTGIVGESQQNIIDSDKGIAFAIRNGKFVTAISVNGTDWFAEDEGDTVSSESAYEIKMTFTCEGVSYIVRTFVKESGAWRQMGAGISASAPVHATTTYWGGANPKAANHIFLGSINLNECRMVLDGNEVWSGYDVLARNLVTYDQTKPISEQLNTAEKIASLSAYPISDLVGGALKDRTVNHATDGGTFTFPARTGSNARDFVLVIDALSEAPTVIFPGSFTYVSEQDAADIWTAEADKVNAWYFSEVADGVFMVCHKAMGVVAQ